MGGQDPNERIHEMFFDGVSVEALYPSKTLSHYSLTDAAVRQAEVFRRYNDWLLEYCSVARLVDRSVVHLDVRRGSRHRRDGALRQPRHARRVDLDAAAGGFPFILDHYYRFWDVAQDLNMPINLHITTGFHYLIDPKFSQGVERVRGTTNQKTMDAMKRAR